MGHGHAIGLTAYLTGKAYALPFLWQPGMERAIDEIIRYDFMNIYKKVKRTKITKADKA